MPDVYAVDRIDAAILDLFTVEPRIGVLEASRRLHLARGTVQSRLDKLTARGIVRGWGPDLDPAALGYPVTAFLTLEIDQPGHEEVGARLADIPEVLEVLTITGNGDLLCRVVARTNSDLQRVIDLVAHTQGVARTSTVVALATQVPHRVMPLVAEVADD
jgi:DNA-binding Lrp family transcriptional regulator